MRVPDGTTENIKRVLDMGCSGIIVPMVNTVAYAQRIAALSKYPPVGERSVGIGRAQGYGLRFTEYLEMANEQTTVVVQIEHRDAVANVDQMLPCRESTRSSLGLTIFPTAWGWSDR